MEGVRLESRLSVVTEKNEQSVLQGVPRFLNVFLVSSLMLLT